MGEYYVDPEGIWAPYFANKEYPCHSDFYVRGNDPILYYGHVS